ncbi:hypothetical protein BU16DRAFT_527496, partial [Lophium mytilinum]
MCFVVKLLWLCLLRTSMCFLCSFDCLSTVPAALLPFNNAACQLCANQVVSDVSRFDRSSAYRTLDPAITPLDARRDATTRETEAFDAATSLV